VVGLGSVGGEVARRLAAAGARLVVADIDPARRALAEELDATWAAPDEALTAPVDVLVPAAMGGVLDRELVPRLRCTAIAGPANNQLADESVADELHGRGIRWAPDYVVGAGGVAYIGSLELLGVGPDEAAARVRAIGDRLATILAAAEQDGITPHHAAQRLVAERLRRAKQSTVDEPVRL
jgi:leucine dehydrogenase